VQYRFDGGAATWLAVRVAACLASVFTLGLAAPWAAVMTYRWQTKHTTLNGYRLRFTGTGLSLACHWCRWLFLTVVTFGWYGFWVPSRLTRWKVEHQEVDGPA
jgi:uncharacterized membrane protein YjgN (DUF898 family)